MGQHRVRFVFLARGTEHHVHEVGGVVEIVARIHEGLAGVVLVGHRHDGRQFCDQADEGDITVGGIGKIRDIVIEGRQGAYDTDHYRHRMRVTTETLIELHQLLMHHGVIPDALAPVFPLAGMQVVQTGAWLLSVRRRCCGCPMPFSRYCSEAR